MTQSRIYLAVLILGHSVGWASFNPCKWVSDCLVRSDTPTGFVVLSDEPNKKSAEESKNAQPDIQLLALLKPHIKPFKEIFGKHEAFKSNKVQAAIVDYLGDTDLIPYGTLRKDSYMSSGRCQGSKAFFLPILHMQFSSDGSRLIAAMSFSKSVQSSQYIAWSICTGQCVENNCQPYWDVEIECARPPKAVSAVSPDGALKAIVTHEFYPNDGEYPAPGYGAYRPQYEACVDLVLNCTYKQFLAYIFLNMGK